MTKHYLHILSFLLVISGSLAQKEPDSLGRKWDKLNAEIDQGSLNEVKLAFNDFASTAIEYKQDSILSHGILLVGDFYKAQEEYSERIKWYKYAIDSLCHQGSFKCINIKREFAAIYYSIGEYDKAIELLKSSQNYIDKNKFSRAG